MSQTEYKKISQVIGELTLYLLNKGQKKFDISFKNFSDKEVIDIETGKLNKKDLDFLIEKMGRDRETEIEAYGWSLMGDSELEITGLLIDHIEIDEQEDFLKIKLIRLKKTK